MANETNAFKAATIGEQLIELVERLQADNRRLFAELERERELAAELQRKLDRALNANARGDSIRSVAR